MSPKYRHRGYQDANRDDDRERSRPQSPPRNDLTTEERIQRRSLRHAMDREANEVLRCPVCGRGLSNFGAIGKSSNCAHCNAALHCCRACLHFDSAARWQCRAEIEQAVSDKNGANDCSKFGPRLVLDSTGRRTTKPGGGGAPEDPRSAFESLFKR